MKERFTTSKEQFDKKFSEAKKYFDKIKVNPIPDWKRLDKIKTAEDEAWDFNDKLNELNKKKGNS